MVDERGISRIGLRIRRYAPTDRDAVRRLALACADQRVIPAWLNNHRELVADILTGYYADFEPESCWVADDATNRVVGYLLGCLSTARRNRIMRWRIVPTVVLRETESFGACPVDE